MNRTKSRRSPMGVESLEGRLLTAIYMKVDGVAGRVESAAEVQTVGGDRLDVLQGDTAPDAAASKDVVMKGQKILQN